MDPDEVLRQAREAAAVWRDLESCPADQRAAYADILAEHFDALDEWLTKGGFPPRDWQAQR